MLKNPLLIVASYLPFQTNFCKLLCLQSKIQNFLLTNSKYFSLERELTVDIVKLSESKCPLQKESPRLITFRYFRKINLAARFGQFQNEIDTSSVIEAQKNWQYYKHGETAFYKIALSSSNILFLKQIIKLILENIRVDNPRYLDSESDYKLQINYEEIYSTSKMSQVFVNLDFLQDIYQSHALKSEDHKMLEFGTLSYEFKRTGTYLFFKDKGIFKNFKMSYSHIATTFKYNPQYLAWKVFRFQKLELQQKVFQQKEEQNIENNVQVNESNVSNFQNMFGRTNSLSDLDFVVQNGYQFPQFKISSLDKSFLLGFKSLTLRSTIIYDNSFLNDCPYLEELTLIDCLFLNSEIKSIGNVSTLKKLKWLSQSFTEKEIQEFHPHNRYDIHLLTSSINIQILENLKNLEVLKLTIHKLDELMQLLGLLQKLKIRRVVVYLSDFKDKGYLIEKLKWRKDIEIKIKSKQEK